MYVQTVSIFQDGGGLPAQTPEVLLRVVSTYITISTSLRAEIRDSWSSTSTLTVSTFEGRPDTSEPGR